MESRDSGAAKHLVMPGDVLTSGSEKSAGVGTLLRNNELIATKVGYIKENSNTISVKPIKTNYIPRSGDLIIGIVNSMKSNVWFLDVAGPFDAILPMSLAPWKVEFGTVRQYIDIGEAVLARVQEVDETHSVVCTMKGMGLRKLASGYIDEIPPHMVETVNGDKSTILQSLKEKSGCRIVVCENGRIWVDGDSKGIAFVQEAIEVIRNISKMKFTWDELENMIISYSRINGGK